MTFKAITTTVALLLAPVASTSAQDSLPVTRPTSDGKTLVVPDAHRSKGTVYYTIPDRDRQVYFESDAPLEDIQGQSNGVIGYAVASPSEQGALVAGEWHLPVTSLRTGIKLRDEHLAGKDWLDAESHPNIIVQVRDFTNRREVKRTSAFSTIEGTLTADLTLHGVTRTIEIPKTTVTTMPESEATRKIARGDLMAIRASLSVVLADYDVSHPVIGQKVAREVKIDVSLFHSTSPPNRQ